MKVKRSDSHYPSRTLLECIKGISFINKRYPEIMPIICEDPEINNFKELSALTESEICAVQDKRYSYVYTFNQIYRVMIDSFIRLEMMKEAKNENIGI